ncbi:MAG: glycosyltransferase family 4 protein [Pseudomonadota bacterium]
MRILNITSVYPPASVGGAELGAHNIAQEWLNQGHEVHTLALCAPAAPENCDSHAGSEIDGVAVRRIPLQNIYWPFDAASKANHPLARLGWHAIDTHNPFMARRVLRHAREIQPEVVFTRNLQGFSTAVLPALHALGVPLIHVLHDMSLICVRTALYKNNAACGEQQRRCLDCRALTLPRRRHLYPVQATISPSRFIADVHQRHGLFTNIPAHVIPHALRRDVEPRIAAPDRAADEPLRFGVLGRVHPAKGVETILKAAAQLSANKTPFSVTIAGTGEPEYLRTLQNCALSEVRFVGPQNTQAYLRNIDVLLFTPESTESFGNVVIEAFSQGVPVISSDCGGPTELICGGSNGLVVPRADASALADAMQRLISSPSLQHRLARTALQSASQYTPARTADAYLNVVRSLTGATP